MTDLRRRSFLKLLGQGTAAFGLGLSSNAWARSGGNEQARQVEDPKHPDWNDWEFYYPGVYDARDTKTLNEFQAGLALINNKGNVSIDDLINGRLEGKPGIAQVKEITPEIINSYATQYGAHNPLWTDKKYAKKTKWGAMAMPFAAAEPSYMPAMPKAKGIGDYMVITSHNDAINYYLPVYEGDKIYTVYDRQYCVDITPASGSYYRTFAMYGWGRHFNQKGELVAEGANILKESFRRHKDPAKRNPDGAHAWESPNWWKREAYTYTDRDWEEIKNIWKNQKIRGTEVLYWDDVNIGDEPPPRAVGPLLNEEVMEMLGLFEPIPQWSIDMDLNMLDSKKLKTMVKNKFGIYVPPEHLERKPPSPENATPVSKAAQTPQITSNDGRAAVQNAVCPKFVAGMLYNWMGDQGWIQRMSWDMMEYPVGTSESINFRKHPTIIPFLENWRRPDLFDKYPYLEKVPIMYGKRAGWHALEQDLIICKAYVIDKYKQGDEYFADLIFWCETFDRFLVEEGSATIKLPKK